MWLSRCFAAVRWRGFRGCGRARRNVAIDDVLPLADRNPARRRDLVLDRDEAERAGAAGLHGHVRDARTAFHLVADPQGVEKFQFAAGPHPARQRHRRQKTAAGGMAIRAELRHRIDRLRQAPMRGEGCCVTRLRVADFHEQGGTQAAHQVPSDDIDVLFGVAIHFAN